MLQHTNTMLLGEIRGLLPKMASGKNPSDWFFIQMDIVQEKLQWFKARYRRYFTRRSGLAGERVKECIFRAHKKIQSNISYLSTLRLLPCTKKSGLKSQNIKNVQSKVNSKSSQSLEDIVTLEKELCDTSCVTTTNKVWFHQSRHAPVSWPV